MERTNFRYATSDLFTIGRPQFATIDVSFISIRLIFPALKQIISKDGDVMALVKPQFEAGKGKVGKKGIVREFATHLEVLKRFADSSFSEGFSLRGASFSPLQGAKEISSFFFIYLRTKSQKNCLKTNFSTHSSMTLTRNCTIARRKFTFFLLDKTSDGTLTVYYNISLI